MYMYSLTNRCYPFLFSRPGAGLRPWRPRSAAHLNNSCDWSAAHGHDVPRDDANDDAVSSLQRHYDDTRRQVDGGTGLGVGCRIVPCRVSLFFFVHILFLLGFRRLLDNK